MNLSKTIGVLVSILLIVSCKEEPKNIDINTNELLENVRILSNDSLEGRAFTTVGNEKARKFIIKKFEEIGINPLYDNLEIPFTVTLKGKQRQAVFPINNLVMI
ncbi:MAG: hypothetical protein HC798_01600 [Polaribacter sp.]|nr:hypothetical protein [Polaribacter sp.]